MKLALLTGEFIDADASGQLAMALVSVTALAVWLNMRSIKKP